VPLTDEGRARARELGHRIARRAFALVLSSPLSRAIETAELAGLEPQLRDDLVEFDYGEYEGITTAQIRESRPDWYLWRDGSPKGETAEDVGRRVDRVIEEALRADGDVALVAHGHVLRALAARWVEQPASFGGRLRLDTGTISVLGFEREVRVIRRWNT
jgi:broad specificity phosphatase PhoE